jgi:predicted phosphodiesterase
MEKLFAKFFKPWLEVKKVKLKTYIVVSDVHVPAHDKRCHTALLEFMRDTKPDGLIIAGDFLDLPEVSTHSKASLLQLETKRLHKSFSAGNLVLDDYDKAVGKQCTDKHYIEGNHESRLDRWIAQGDNAVFAGDEAVSIPSRLGLPRRGYTYHGTYPNAYVKLGHLVITHGRFTGANPAKKMLDTWGTSVVFGHVHTPSYYAGPAFLAQRVAIGLGHLADPKTPEMSYAGMPNAWIQGFAVLYVASDGTFTCQPIHFWNKSFVHAGKKYG